MSKSLNTAFTKNFSIPQEVTVISFDIFDTLLLRPFEKPSDLFSFLTPYVQKILQKKVNFYRLRKNIEKKVREAAFPNEDVTIDEIYNNFKELSLKARGAIKFLELETELKLCYPRKSGQILYEKAKQSGLKMIATSDIYFEKGFLKRLLERNGFYFDEIFCSAELKKRKKTGNIYPLVLEKLQIKPYQLLHIGDNQISDIENAKKHDIHTFHLPLLRDVFYANKHYKKIFYKKDKCILTSASIALMLEKIDVEGVNSNSSLFDGSFYKIGFNSFGALMFAFTNWVFNKAKEANLNKIFFLSRDGFIMQKMFQLNHSGEGIEAIYLECSRRSLTPFLINSKEDVIKVFSKKYRNTSISNFISQKLECNPSKIEPQIKQFGFNSMEDEIKSKIHSKSEKNRLASVVEFYAEEIFQKMQKEKVFAMKFAEKRGLLSGDFGFCDVGYGATTQKIISQIKQEGKIFGFYLITNYEAKKVKNSFGFLKSFMSKLKFKRLTSFVRLTETIIFSAPSGSVLNYDEKGEPIYDDLLKSEQKRLEANALIWQGMIDFSTLLKQRFGSEVNLLTSNPKSLVKLFASFAFSPEKQDAEMLKGIVFENKSNAGGHQDLIQNSVWKHGAFAIKFPNLFKVVKPIVKKFSLNAFK